MEYTQGPWKVFRFYWSDNPESVRQEIVTEKDGTPICQLTGNEANAFLIAAAPLMYKALLAMLRARETPMVDDDFPAILKQADVLMDAAIAAADGKDSE